MRTNSVLVVDDEEDVRVAISRTLQRDGFEVHTASGPAEAFLLLKSKKIDLVISDHMMPDMTGLEFLALVRDRYPDVGRIILTGHADMDLVIKSINHGEIYRFIQKPWDTTELRVLTRLACEHVELERENRRLLAIVRAQDQMLRIMERDHPGITTVHRDERGAIILDDIDPKAAQ